MTEVLQAARLIAYTLAIALGLLIISIGLTLSPVAIVAIGIVPMIVVVALDRGVSVQHRGLEDSSWSR